MERTGVEVTFLFTDIEGSTRLWEEHEDLMDETLERHDAIMRASVDGAGGRVFKHTGDGMVAAFDGVEAAATAAVSAQNELRRHDWGRIGELRARVGIHAGTATRRGDDYFGRDVNRCARLMDAAHGGQVVVSSAAAGELDPAGPYSVVDLGVHQLRDLSQPEQVLQLCHDSLPSSFPPLRTARADHHHLPAVTDLFVGRSREVDEVGRLLGTSRLVTLTGPGGVGKTQLALAAAGRAAPEFTDGAWFVNVRPATDTDGVAELLLSATGLSAATGETPLEKLAAGLGSRSALLVVDGAEGVAGSVTAAVAPLLQDCPKLKVLVTSRELLRARGEQALVVAPLSAPREPVHDPDQARTYPAVELFERRAQLADPAFTLSEAVTPAVASLCDRLDGLPLAVEMAAAQMGIHSPADLDRRLGARVGLIDDRDQTLSTIIDWSYRSLGNDEQLLVQRLAVFARGCTLLMAERVCGTDDLTPEDVMMLMSGLVDRSVVSVTADDDERRYRLLAVIRGYALERLEDRGELAETRQRHLEAYLEFVAEASIGMRTAREREWADRIDREFGNIRSAFEYAMESGQVTEALQLVYGASRFALNRLRYEVISWAEQAVDQADPDDPWLAIGLALGGAGASNRGDFDESIRMARRAIEIDERHGGFRPFQAHRVEAISHILKGDGAEAARVAKAAREAAIRLDRPDQEIEFTAVEALATLNSGDRVRAHELAAAAVEAARDLRNPTLVGWSLYVAGVVDVVDDDAGSLAMLEEAIEFADMVDNRYLANNALLVASWKRGQHDPGRAAALDFVQVINHWYRVANWANLENTLRLCAETFATSPDAEIVAVIDGWLSRTGASNAVTAPPTDSYADQVTAVRRDLGDDRFVAARRRGERMDVSELVTYCRTTLGAITG